jgi:hypothetical protein
MSNGPYGTLNVADATTAQPEPPADPPIASATDAVPHTRTG